jgi:thioesterase domain-containing protein
MTADTSRRIKNLTPAKRALLEKQLSAMNEPKEIPPFILTLRKGNPEKKTPVYCFHPALGAAGYYLNIGKHLDPDQPWFGVQSPAFNNVREPLDDMREMAAYYLEAIRTVQPNGHFILMGHSSGANIAYEMALQNQTAGTPTPLLVVMDQSAPDTGTNPVLAAFLKEGFADSVDGLYLCAWCVSIGYRVSLPFTQDDLASLSAKERDERVGAFFKEVGFIPKSADTRLVQAILRMVANHSRADAGYNAMFKAKGIQDRYHGKTILIRCTEMTTWPGLNLTTEADVSSSSGWNKFCDGPIHVHGIEGADHVSIAADPAVKKIADLLQPYFDEVKPS